MTNRIKELSVNWQRSIFIDTAFDDDLLRKLTPEILKQRQESTDPITIAIDSPGGSLATLDALLGLLTGPSQEGKNGSVVSVVTNRAYSAAATLLALSDYSVALKHSEILFHDVRYGGIQDVTPSKARAVASSLQLTNDEFALRLANRLINRLIWVFIDQKKDFEKYCGEFSSVQNQYRNYLGDWGSPKNGQNFFDVAGFATCLYAQLSSTNEVLVNNVMMRLGKWVILRGLAARFPSYREKGSRKQGLLDGAKALHKVLDGNSERFEKSEKDLKLVFALLVAELTEHNGSSREFNLSLEEATRNFALIQSMDDRQHNRSATRLMLRHQYLFFGKVIDGLNEDERKEEIRKAAPYAQLFWLFCVSLCRELFEGEHVLKPNEAQLLGLIDEVAGGGPVESRREYQVKMAKQKSASTV
jgi:hypothetical protein